MGADVSCSIIMCSNLDSPVSITIMAGSKQTASKAGNSSDQISASYGEDRRFLAACGLLELLSDCCGDAHSLQPLRSHGRGLCIRWGPCSCPMAVCQGLVARVIVLLAGLQLACCAHCKLCIFRTEPAQCVLPAGHMPARTTTKVTLYWISIGSPQAVHSGSWPVSVPQGPLLAFLAQTQLRVSPRTSKPERSASRSFRRTWPCPGKLKPWWISANPRRFHCADDAIRLSL